MTRIGRQRGMSLTTGFDVYVDFPATNTLPQKYYFGGDEEIVHIKEKTYKDIKANIWQELKL